MSPEPALTRDDAPASPVLGDLRPGRARRVTAYAALGGCVAAVPLPWLPQSLLRRLRGALVHDVAVRHGLSLTPEARGALAEPGRGPAPAGVATQALHFLGGRFATRVFARFGPLGWIWPARGALRTYLLGHLFERYLEVGRTEHAVRIDLAEARRVRHAIDGTLARAFTVGRTPAAEPTPIDDQRDAVTRIVDDLAALAASLPDRLMRQIDAAFDDLVARADG